MFQIPRWGRFKLIIIIIIISFRLTYAFLERKQLYCTPRVYVCVHVCMCGCIYSSFYLSKTRQTTELQHVSIIP